MYTSKRHALGSAGRTVPLQNLLTLSCWPWAGTVYEVRELLLVGTAAVVRINPAGGLAAGNDLLALFS
jgi:hypothetical protein